EECPLAERVPAVLVPKLGIFEIDVERLAGSSAGDELVRFLIELVHRVEGARRVESPRNAVELRQQRAAILKTFHREARSEVQVLHLETGVVRITSRGERIVLIAEQ